ncbi:PREDICTED: ubiquitin carboxyl-terminal hydrolase 17-like isoform X2 [Ipomoea nil]|uniref:ubiquitin carboxyl-terminal hydrolase 17-like isoform X2 n=1 Tax=Ipomoea nil TaxID=35883 RepID=UPI000900A3F5|nr:PREDICTED: ubiquitin carboxyl-terminal hydrolase 17-like isoform X2 [Ipomoea nil]
MLLGLPSFVVVVLLIFGLFIRSICRSATDKEEEITRFVTVAAKEAKHVEPDGSVGYNSGSVESLPLKKGQCCAVCYCPTTTRCSRCKAVRYCSRNCQIFHWRQGHKDECQAQIALHTDRGSKHVMPLTEVKAFSNSVHMRSGPPSPNISQPYSSSSTPKSEISYDTCRSEVAGLGTSEISSSDASRMFTDIGDAGQQRCIPLGSPLCSSKSFQNKEASCGTAMLKEITENKRINSSYCEKEDLSPISNGAKFIPARDQGYNGSSAYENNYASPLEVGNVLNVSQRASKGLRTSIWNVIQHFRPIKYSKSNTQHIEQDCARKSNHKAIFPYELFAQLYTVELVELYPFGLLNCGNSCYANAVLQCMAFTRPITYYLLQGLHTKTCQKIDWCFICEFECLILKGREGMSPLSPIGILSHIQKIGSCLIRGREEDAHEFLRYAVDTMQSIFLKEAGAKGHFAEESTLVGLTFGGYLCSKIKCLKCSGRSEQFDWIMDLSVEIDGDIETLEEALAQFSAPEILDGENKYKCSRCKSYQKAEKKLTVHEAPNILTVILKRFQLGGLGKLNKSVQFPEVLNLAPFISGTTDKDSAYILYGVVVHLDMMNAAYSGHYISYVKDFQGQWFRIDDCRVVPVESQSVLYERPYILFYARQTPCLVRNFKISSDLESKRSSEAISSGNIKKKKKSKLSTSRDSGHLLHRSDPNDHSLDLGGWRSVDSSSDTSSIFSFSDTSSYSTDSTKDSSAEEISGYIFGSS